MKCAKNDYVYNLTQTLQDRGTIQSRAAGSQGCTDRVILRLDAVSLKYRNVMELQCTLDIVFAIIFLPQFHRPNVYVSQKYHVPFREDSQVISIPTKLIPNIVHL